MRNNLKPKARLSLVGVKTPVTPPVTPQRILDAVNLRKRGNHAVYRHGETNYCPSCSRSQWHVGRSSAECAFCATPLPFGGGPA